MTGEMTGLGAQQDQVKRHWNYDKLYFRDRVNKHCLFIKLYAVTTLRIHVLNTHSIASETGERGIRKYRQIQPSNV